MKIGVLPSVETKMPTTKMSLEDFKAWFRAYSSGHPRPRTDSGWAHYNAIIKATLERVDVNES